MELDFFAWGRDGDFMEGRCYLGVGDRTVDKGVEIYLTAVMLGTLSPPYLRGNSVWDLLMTRGMLRLGKEKDRRERCLWLEFEDGCGIFTLFCVSEDQGNIVCNYRNCRTWFFLKINK